MADPYNLSLTAAQIDTALLAASDSDKPPSSGATNLVNSNRIYQAIQAESSARTSADSALDARVSALESLNEPAFFSKTSGSASATGLISGYTETDTSGIASESSGTITVTGSGLYLIGFYGVYSESDLDNSDYFNINYRINSSTIVTRIINEVNRDLFFFSYPYSSAGSFTLDIQTQRVSSTTLTYTDILISIAQIYS